MKLYDLIKNIDVLKTYGDTSLDITHITNNSKACTSSSLFIAVKGFSTDGHKYIKNAVENGAKAIVCTKYDPEIEACQIVVSDSRKAEAKIACEFYQNPAESFKLLGITGTNGKTTTTYLVKHVLEDLGYKVGLIGTNQNMIGDKVFDTERTTPDSIELQKLFALMRDEKVDFCVMEVSSHALELDRVYGINYEVGAFTNLTRDHLDFHKTMDNYALSKAKLFDISSKAVINADDSYGFKMAQNTKCETLTYSIKNDATYKANDILYKSDKIEFLVDDLKYVLSIPGEFSVYNALCAISILKAVGIESEKIASSLKNAHGVKGRCEVVKVDKDYSVIIDYAHTPDGIENILKTFRPITKGRIIIVFGCGGDRDNTKRAIMGKIAGELADILVVTSDNPRTEDPMKIINMIVDGVKETNACYSVIESRKEAIRYALNIAKKDDVVLLCGKGHETYQILNSGTIHFDEREVVREILS